MAETESIIADKPPNDGREWDSQCARCGGATDSVECEACGGEGHTEPGELYEEDPLWYDEDDVQQCGTCLGAGGWRVCGNSKKWCNANPQPGREQVERGALEWFTYEKTKEVSGG